MKKQFLLLLLLCSVVLSGYADDRRTARCDVNGDGRVSVSDITYIAAVALGQNPDAIPLIAVDLGLASGTKWCNMNVGATSPDENGNFYCPGEVETKSFSEFTKNNYKWGIRGSYTRYSPTDSIGELLPEDDAAYVVQGSNWRMPTAAQLEELCNECTWTTSVLNSTPGYIVTGKNGNYIFLPMAGCLDADDYGSVFYSWPTTIVYPSRQFNTERYGWSRIITILKGEDGDGLYDGACDRSNGFLIRAVYIGE